MLRARYCLSEKGSDVGPEAVRGRLGKPEFPIRLQEAEKRYAGEVERPRLPMKVLEESGSFPFGSDTTLRGLETAKVW